MWRGHGTDALGAAVGTEHATHGHAAEVGDLAARLPSLRRSQVAVARVPSRARLPVLTCTGLETNLPALQLSGRRSGFLSAVADPDGAVRRAALVARCGEAYYVSLGLAVYEVASGQRTALIGDQERLLAIQLGGRAFQVDEGGKILIMGKTSRRVSIPVAADYNLGFGHITAIAADLE